MGSGCTRGSTVIRIENETVSQSVATLHTQTGTSNNRGRPLPPTPQVLKPHDNRETCQPSKTRTVRPNHVIHPKKFINILLLGESGVGKSTFINAIVNYFHFDTLAQARATDPIALMPVSFIITEGHNFHERLITFGDPDHNEDHHHPEQSVTQRCRSYRFPISTHTTVRLIDTPGMGDTRGVEQDDRNMQHILSFISHLSHLDAICILLKPNLARLNVVFRSYFTRLLGFMGEGARNNVIFCFTNTRSTFFTPGDTGPLLKKMLASHSIRDIPYTKNNTFCFDSESFRYLIARRSGVQFDDYQEDEYEGSWKRSAVESRRLFEYIGQEVKSYRQEEWRSVEHARFQIDQMVRPMLETLRNGIRNMLILETTSPSQLIRFTARETSKDATICLNCRTKLECLNGFWILEDVPHSVTDRCKQCSCPPSQHLKASYLLEYKDWKLETAPAAEKLKSTREELEGQIISFGRFCRDAVRLRVTDDTISAALNQMIKDEKYICSVKESSALNSSLREELKRFRKRYEAAWSEPTSAETQIDLHETYKRIEAVRNDKTIHKQMDTIKKSEQVAMDEQEKDVSREFSNTSTNTIESHAF